MRYILLCVVDATGRPLSVYALSETRHGQLLLIFTRLDGELPTFRDYVQSTLKSGFTVKTMAILAANLDQVHDTLQERGLMPGGENCVAVEGTEFFDECIAELVADTIWADD